jgi:hypothetical protein
VSEAQRHIERSLAAAPIPEAAVTRATTRLMYRSEEWARPSELRRRCALLHHGRNPGPTAYKYAARFSAGYGVLPSEFEKTQQPRSHGHIEEHADDEGLTEEAPYKL